MPTQKKLPFSAAVMSAVIAGLIALSVLPCSALVLRVGIGFSIAPYVIQEKDAGMEVDIIREALKQAGHEAIFVYLPNLRLPVTFAAGEVDCVVSNAAYDIAADSGRKAYASETTIVFQNYAISLESRGIRINKIGDLAKKRVLAFNNASKYLGPEYAATVAKNSDYRELADQSLQVRLLYSRRVDTVISDKRIFLYWRSRLAESSLAESLDLLQQLSFDAIFPEAPRFVAFAEASVRDDFNRGLQMVKASGSYDAIVARYCGAGATQ